MDTLMKADIFFVVTTVAVMLITVCAIVAIVYLIFILRDLRHLMRRIRDEGAEIMDDVKAVREGVEYSGQKVQDAIAWIGRIVMKLFMGGRR